MHTNTHTDTHTDTHITHTCEGVVAILYQYAILIERPLFQVADLKGFMEHSMVAMQYFSDSAFCLHLFVYNFFLKV